MKCIYLIVEMCLSNAFIGLITIHWSSFAQHAPMLLTKMKLKPNVYPFGFSGSFSQANVSDYEINWFLLARRHIGSRQLSWDIFLISILYMICTGDCRFLGVTVDLQWQQVGAMLQQNCCNTIHQSHHWYCLENIAPFSVVSSCPETHSTKDYG